MKKAIVSVIIAVIIRTTQPYPNPFNGGMRAWFEQAGRNIDKWPRGNALGAVATAAATGSIIGTACYALAAPTGLGKVPYLYAISTAALSIILGTMWSWAWFFIKPKLTKQLIYAGYEMIKGKPWVPSDLTESDYERKIVFDYQNSFQHYRQCVPITIASSGLAATLPATITASSGNASLHFITSAIQCVPHWTIPIAVGGLTLAMLTLSQHSTIQAIVHGKYEYQQSPNDH